jgi:hypothetical protein
VTDRTTFDTSTPPDPVDTFDVPLGPLRRTRDRFRSLRSVTRGRHVGESRWNLSRHPHFHSSSTRGPRRRSSCEHARWHQHNNMLYFDQSHFLKAFRQYTGVTPRAYSATSDYGFIYIPD